ncbi:uncharacterized protein LOC110249115 [Exaiptasia diaphana]|uniref:UspA domain-containing protein n=1 Tax=Exaiptasia diaphana TaxID=2652724 RepID=A0A913XXC1_EXADI|nr:uncharacterized protein LOC110249115 [Exaiptasia diaphana]
MMAESKKKTVVIAVDNGKHSEHAFDWYMENLHSEKDHVIVFHCEDILYKPADPYTEQTLDWKHKEEKYHRNEEKFISYYYEKCKAVCCKSPLDATIHVEHKNHVAQRIRQFALDKKAAYVVIGSRGLGRILRSLVSAVSDDVVHYSKIPVVVVPFHQE